MITVTGLDHLVLRAADTARLERFYCEVLGATVERRLESIGLVQLRFGAQLLDLLPGREPGPGLNLDHFCLNVRPFDEAAIRTHLAAHGVEAGPLATRYGSEGDGPSIYLHDPEGNQVELKGPPHGAAA